MYAIDFVGDKMLLVMGRSDKHSAIYSSYNKDLASIHIQSIAKEDIMNTCSIANELKYNVNDAIKKHVLYKQFVAWTCDGFCIVRLIEKAILAN